MSEVLKLKPMQIVNTYSKGIFDAAVRDSAKTLFEMIDMEYDDGIIDAYLATSDGKALIAYTARLFAYINERKIVALDLAAGLAKAKP